MAAAPHLAPNELAAIGRLKEILARDFDLVKLILYGSKARGDSNEESDVDLIVVLRHPPDWRVKRAIYRRCSEIGLEYDIVFQPVVFAESEFDSPRFRVTPLLRNVAAEGLAV